MHLDDIEHHERTREVEHLALFFEIDFVQASAVQSRAGGSILYYSPAGKQRTPLHFDPAVNVVLQVEGQKRVRLFPPSASEALRPAGGLTPAFLCWLSGVLPAVYAEASEEVWPDSDELVLVGGDLLAIPAGWWHSFTGGDGPNASLVFPYIPSA